MKAPWNCLEPRKRWPHFQSLGHFLPLLDIAALECISQATREFFPDDDPLVAIEIGSFVGTTALVLAEHFDKVHCVDTWTASASDDPINDIYRKLENEVYEVFHANVLRHEEIEVHRMTSREAAPLFANESAHLGWLDGDHSYEAVLADIRLYLPKIKRGGFMMGHDLNDAFPGVGRAVGELFKPERISKIGQCCWVVQV